MPNHLPSIQAEKVVALVESIPESHSLLHGDLHIGNVILHDGEFALIDLKTPVLGILRSTSALPALACIPTQSTPCISKGGPMSHELVNAGNRPLFFNMIYALAAKDGRDLTLFGPSHPIACEAFERGLCGTAFPELWFEMPLSGEPWYDLHMLVARSDMQPGISFSGLDGAYTDGLTWFASSKHTRQLALSFDTGCGNAELPAIQLLLDGPSLEAAQGFLSAVGSGDLFSAYRSFVKRIPKGWYACYLGTFPARVHETDGAWVRVECIVGEESQQRYARDAQFLRDDLNTLGMPDPGDAFIAYVQELARSPFPLELQFNIGTHGKPLPVLSASVRFQSEDWFPSSNERPVDALLQKIEDQGLSDDRWYQLQGTAYAQRASMGGQSTLLYCFPAFIKLRWREGLPVDAKTYLIAGTQEAPRA